MSKQKEIKDLIELKERINNFPSLSTEEKNRVLIEISNGKNFDFKTGYAIIDRPWLQFFDMEKYYEMDNDKTVYQDIVAMNHEYMNDLAIMFFGSKISYKQMFDKIDETAKSLSEYGIKKGDYVTICSAGIPELIYTFYALSKIGAISNLMAPNFEPKQMIDRICDCESDTLIVMDKFYPVVKDAIKKSSIKRTIVIPTLNSSLLRFIPNKNKIELDYVNELWWNEFIKDGRKTAIPKTMPYEKKYPLCMVYSSGTTGASKAILLSNDSFQNSVLSYDPNSLDILRGQRFYQIIPPWYSTGLNSSIHLPIHRGVTVFLDPRFERDVFVKNIVKNDIDFTIAPTSMYEGFLDEKLTKGKKVKHFTNPFEGGEKLPFELKTKIEESIKKMGCETVIRVGYGQCECGAQITTQTQNVNHPDGSVGLPIPGVTIGIFDDDFNELQYHQRGNILVNTECGMLEYYKRPEATKEYFYTDQFGTKWSCTGDIGYLDENGDLFIEGRKEDYSMVGNKKIYNFDIEDALINETDIKICDCVSMEPNGFSEGFALHIIFEETKKKQYEEDPEKLLKRLKEIQEIIYDKYDDIDMIPTHFKIRDSFPFKPFGKRDTEKLKKETDGFIFIGKEAILKTGKEKIKRI